MFNKNQKCINFDDLMDVDNLGILEIDMQLRFVNRIFSEDEEKLVLSSHRKILTLGIDAEIPTCLIEYSHIKAGKTINEIYNLVKKIKNNLYISKSKNSAFYEPLIHKFLIDHKIKNLIIMGFHANICIKETIKDAIENGFNVYTSMDLITDYSKELKEEIRDFIEDNCTIIKFN